MLDLDGNGKIEVDEICIVHDSDKDSMIKILDANGVNQVDKDEWIGYMMIKKAEKGDRKFGFFLNYLEKEIPDKIPAMKIQRAKKAKNQEPVEDVADIIFECPHAKHGLPVPESVVKKRATAESVAMARAEEAANAKAGRKAKRNEAYANAEAYAKEYRAIARRQVRMRRQAKAAGNHFVEPEAKLMFVVRIRGLNDMHPKTKKILQLMRLRQMNMGVFMKVSKAATEMLKRVEPYISYGYPNVKSVRPDLQAWLWKGQQEPHSTQRQFRHRGRSRQHLWHQMHGGPCARDCDRGAKLHKSQQLPLAFQAAPS